MGMELRAEGFNAVLSLFRNDPASPDEEMEDAAGTRTGESSGPATRNMPVLRLFSHVFMLEPQIFGTLTALTMFLTYQ